MEENFTEEPSPPPAEESIQSAGEEKISQPRLLTDKNNLLGKPLESDNFYSKKDRFLPSENLFPPGSDFSSYVVLK